MNCLVHERNLGETEGRERKLRLVHDLEQVQGSEILSDCCFKTLRFGTA